MARIRGWKAAAALAVLALCLGALLAGCGEESVESAREEGSASPGRERDGSGEGLFDASDMGTLEKGEGMAEGPAMQGTSGGSSLPELQLKVIKNALVKMETDRGGYVHIREDAVALASGAGGYVQGESSGRDDDGLTHATLTLRIPAAEFDEVMNEVSTLGEVTSAQVSTSDVSAEYVDLESRLRHLQAEEAFYLSLIGEAKSVQEMISIREHLSSVQLEKEQVQGRMNYLDRQVEFSTLTLSVDEVGEEEAGGFWNSVARAFRAFGRGLRALALGFFYALPYLLAILLVAGLAFYLVRRLRRRPGGPGESVQGKASRGNSAGGGGSGGGPGPS